METLRMKLPGRVLAPVLPPLGVAALVVAAWHFSVVWTGTKVFPSPTAVVRGLGELVHRGVLVSYLLDSLRRVGVGAGLAVAVAVPLGGWMGWHRPTARTLNPVLQVLRPISPLAWMPLAIVFFGVGDRPTYFLIFLASVFPMTLASMSAVQGVPVLYLRAGRNFGLTPAALLRRVVLPATLPELLAGLRLTLGVAWLVLVAAEMLAVDSGLGYLILDARNAGKRYDLVVAGMLIIGGVGLLMDLAVRRMERLKPVRWGFREERRRT